MQALFIGQSYIDVTFITDEIPTGDDKAVAQDYAVSFGGNAVTAAFACAKLGIVPDLLCTVADDWLGRMFTDMAMTTYSSGSGIDVVVRSLSTAKPMAGIKLSLIAENNDELASAVTNGDGQARFGEAAVSGDFPLGPRMLMAYGPQNDFAALDLRRSVVFCDEDAEISDPLQALREAPAAPLTLIVGPEGGFHPKEREALLARSNVIRLSLGPRILRADTAAVAALALVQAVRGDWH